MIELAAIGAILLASGAELGPLFFSLLAAILCASGFNAVIISIQAVPTGAIGHDGHSNTRRVALSAVLALSFALFSLAAPTPLAQLISSSEINSANPAQTTAGTLFGERYVANLGLAAAYGALVAFTALLPGFSTTLLSRTLAIESRMHPAVLRSMTLLIATALMLIFWSTVFEGFYDVVRGGH